LCGFFDLVLLFLIVCICSLFRFKIITANLLQKKGGSPSVSNFQTHKTLNSNSQDSFAAGSAYQNEIMYNSAKGISKIQNHKGFTLIELIVVMVLLGLLASMAVPKFIHINDTAGKKALSSAIMELGSRESMTWANIKTSGGGWISDELVFAEVDTDLGSHYRWSPHAKIDGGILHFREHMIKLDRIPSTNSAPGKWLPKGK
jgi:prepilin-type N-terminal cleavage/methylation domain-containing protein